MKLVSDEYKVYRFSNGPWLLCFGENGKLGFLKWVLKRWEVKDVMWMQRCGPEFHRIWFTSVMNEYLFFTIRGEYWWLLWIVAFVSSILATLIAICSLKLLKIQIHTSKWASITNPLIAQWWCLFLSTDTFRPCSFAGYLYRNFLCWRFLTPCNSLSLEFLKFHVFSVRVYKTCSREITFLASRNPRIQNFEISLKNKLCYVNSL